MEELKELTEKLEQKTRDCENWSKMHSELLELSVNQKTTIDKLREDLKSLELTKQTRLMKQTAVEWLVDEMIQRKFFDKETELSYTTLEHLTNQAKEMEKEQIVDNSKNNWISVNDRLPEESGRYLGYLTELKCLGNSYSTINVAFNTNHKDSTAWTEHGEVLQYITHWMPLPDAPKDVEVISRRLVKL